MLRSSLNAFILGILLLSSISLTYNEQLTITNIDRQILLNGAYPTQQTLISFKSSGNVNVFKHLIPINIDQRVNKIAFMKSKDNKEMLSYTREQYIYDGEKFALYKVQLEREFYEEQTGEIYIVTVFLNRYVNFPQEITMTQDQKFQYKDTKYQVSPYPVEKQSSTYKFDKILSNDKDGEVKGLSTVVFRKNNVEPFSIEYTVLHGVNNDPQVYFTNVQRIIQVSHWGNIAITQFYALKNFGPSLKGEFSRITFGSQSQADAKNSFKGIETSYPYETWGLYYRDEVGNISTSKAYRDEHQSKVRAAFVPRFNLLGGWKANWEIGYNLPTKNYLYNEGNNFQLDNIDLEYSLEKVISENYDLRLILPEGASNVRVKFGGVEIKPSRIEKSFGYLDFFGRPTFIFQGYNGILKKKQITVEYESNSIATLYKPMILFGIVFSILSIMIVLKRLKLQAFKQETKVKQN